MASEILYPPIVDSNSPAFVAGNGCRLYFSLSKFNSRADFKSVQATVVRQSSGISVVNDKTNSATHYRNTGVILNIHPIEKSNNLFYIDIPNEDILGNWTPGWIYKLQIRLSKDNYDPAGGVGQSAWLTANASSFSEWSTVCITKAIGEPNISVTNYVKDILSNIAELNFYGSYECPSDHSETLFSYRVSTELEDSGIIRASAPVSETDIKQNFSYVFKKEYEYDKLYNITFTYETKNKYTNTIKYPFMLNESIAEKVDIYAVTYEENPEYMAPFTSVYQEEEEGRIGIKLYSESNLTYTGSVCLKRSDNLSKFSEWQDIKIINFKNQSVNDYPLIFDYTAESGTAYKYAIQPINTSGIRGSINKMEKVTIRDYNYSFLIGDNDRQLKLKFDNTMSNYKINVGESKTDTVGGTYATFSRNGNMKYKGFPINGLISFNMDEAETFTTRSKAYGGDDIANLFDEYNENNGVSKIYDRIYERAFRNLVLDFLYDGKPKLFKSPTEGNVIVRLMDINCTPNQTTNRLIYSFTSNAYEMAPATIDKFIEYNLLKVGEFKTDILSAEEKRTGSLTLDIPIGVNILDYITEAFSSNDEPVTGGYIEKVTTIKDLTLSINDNPLKVTFIEGGKEVNVLGNMIEYNGNKVLLYNGYYNFGNVELNAVNDSIYLLNDNADYDNINTINVTINCDYNIIQEVYKDSEAEKQYLSKNFIVNYGQLFTNLKPEEDIYSTIVEKHYYKSKTLSIEVEKINEIEIEAPKYSVFKIDGNNHMIGQTELLHLSSSNTFKTLEYLGVREEDNIVKKDISALITYKYTTVRKVFKED